MNEWIRSHLCQEFELLDCNLWEFMRMRQPPSLFLREIRSILSLGILHTDLHPGNIMLVNHVRLPLKLKIIDFGSTRWYQAPETILGLPCNEAIDMWSLGCITVQMLLGFPLYPGSCEYDILWALAHTQGQLPWNVLSSGLNTAKFYNRLSTHPWQLMTPQEYGPTQLKGYKADLECFVALVKQMLELDYSRRTKPCQMLEHSFITLGHLTSLNSSSCAMEQERSLCCYETLQNTHFKGTPCNTV
uniref:Protein kinase domain-containing protein n=1 Tax=Stegastes partitus TaxID=144197 RepID=A0A3B5AAA2_9TELE